MKKLFLILMMCSWLFAAEPMITLDVKGSSLAEVIDIIHKEAQIDFIFDPRINQSVKITASIENKTLNQSLTLILSQCNLSFENIEGVIVIKPQEVKVDQPTIAPMPVVQAPTTKPLSPVVKPNKPVATPAPIPGAATQSNNTGIPNVESKPMPKLVYLKYAYAPGIAVLLQNKKTGVKGTALLYSQVDPWAGAMSGGGGNNAFGGGNQGFGGNQGGFGNNFGGGFGNQGGFGNNNNFGGNQGFGGNRNNFGNNFGNRVGF